MVKQLDALQTEYDQVGYLALRGILRADAMAELSRWVYAQLDDQKRYFQEQTGVVLDDPAAMRAYVAEIEAEAGRFEGLAREIQQLIKGEFPLPVRLAPEFMVLAEETRLHEVLRTLLGDDRLRMHYPPMVRFKLPGEKQASVPLHQDAPYFAHIEQFVNSWIPLCQITDECGGVDVLPGSHRVGSLTHESKELWGSYVEGDEWRRQYPPVHPLIGVGDALLFGPHLLHASHDNTSDRPRCSLDCRWFASTTETTRQYLDLQSKQVVKMF
jgi:ectoine hydroxylase-related dioxygenase (phytanoyl-CoA dioxygenase family)